MLVQFLFFLVLISKRNSILFPGQMSVTSEDKEDISGNPLPLISHVRPMELSIELICFPLFYQSILKKIIFKTNDFF